MFCNYRIVPHLPESNLREKLCKNLVKNPGDYCSIHSNLISSNLTGKKQRLRIGILALGRSDQDMKQFCPDGFLRIEDLLPIPQHLFGDIERGNWVKTYWENFPREPLPLKLVPSFGEFASGKFFGFLSRIFSPPIRTIAEISKQYPALEFHYMCKLSGPEIFDCSDSGANVFQHVIRFTDGEIFQIDYSDNTQKLTLKEEDIY